MTKKYRESYHDEDGLEQAVIDLVRVGSSGFASGVRQLASRLVRTVPPGVKDPNLFRDSVHDALAAGGTTTGLRFSSGELPTADDGGPPLANVDPVPRGDGLVLAAQAMTELEEIIAERDRADELSRAGVGLTRTVMFTGPPGVGKTMAARWIANQIGVPLVSLDLATVTSSFFGDSGRNIRSVLDYAKSGQCVLLLDEFDAIAKRRDDDTDIGELKRIVNVILVELDRWPDTSLLVAATNHVQLLDRAVGRRFDRHVEFQLPTVIERRLIIQALSKGLNDEDIVIIDLIAEATDGATGSDLVRLWNSARRRSVLYRSDFYDELLKEVIWLVSEPRALRDKLWLLASERLGLSNRKIAAATGVSHPTVGAALDRERKRDGGDSGTFSSTATSRKRRSA